LAANKIVENNGGNQTLYCLRKSLPVCHKKTLKQFRYRVDIPGHDSYSPEKGEIIWNGDWLPS